MTEDYQNGPQKKRKESFSNFILETRYFGDPRTTAMCRKFGSQAIAAHLQTLAELNQRPDHTLSRAEFFLLVENHAIEGDIAAFLEFLTADHVGYLALDGDAIFSPGTNKRLEKRGIEREKWRKDKERVRSNGVPHSVHSDSAKTSIEAIEKLKENKGKEKVPIPFRSECPTPTPTPTPTPQNLKKEEWPETDQFDKAALDLLEAPTGSEPWETSNQFMNCGRRPMKKYPNLYFSPTDLAEVFRIWTKAGIPQDRFRDGFQMLKAEMDNKPKSEAKAYVWAIGFIKTNLVASLNEEVKLEKNRARA